MDLSFTLSCITGKIKAKGLSKGFALEERGFIGKACLCNLGFQD